jgi:hypothetical protein
MVRNLRNISTRHLAIAIVAVVLLFLFAFGNICSASVDGGDEVGMLVENIVASLDCDTATFSLACSISSANISLVHFPSPVDMNNAHLKNCTSINVVFTPSRSVLTFQFNDTSTSSARADADAMISSMNAAFDLTFTHNSTITNPSPLYAVVIYTADGKSDMQTFLTNLKTDCIDSSVDGFSDVLSTIFTHAENKTILLTATNTSSTWYNMLMAEYGTTFPLGSGEHTVDILYYLGTSSLRPSDYANVSGYYLSTVMLTINSSSTVTFVRCQPENVTMPIYSTGWYVPEKGPANQISGTMYFGNNPNIGEVITFTFQGTVIPEFTALTSTLTIALISTILLLLRRHQK